MDLKKIIIICAIVLVMILGVVALISIKSGNNSNDVDIVETKEIPDEEVDEEDSETVLITFTNRTGKTIDELYLYNQKDVENGEMIGYEMLDGNELEDGKSTEIEIDRVTEDASWDIKIVTNDGDYEPVYVIGTDYVFDGASLDILLNGNWIDIEFSEEEEEEDYQDENDGDEQEDEGHNEEENYDEENNEEENNNDEVNEEYQENEDNNDGNQEDFQEEW